MNHDGVATAEKECRRVERRKGRARKVHPGFFKEAHLNGGPLISGAAQERRMMLLEELVAVVAGEEASSLTGEADEPGYTQPVEREKDRPQDRNPVAGGCLPRQDADEGGDSCIHLGVKIEEGRKVDVELRNARKEPDASGDAVTDGEAGVWTNCGGGGRRG
jgi:hypothetical protein